MKNINVIIPTCKRSRLLKRTLDSLQTCTLPDVPVSIFVVENGEKHNAEEVVSQCSSGIKINYRYHEKANKSSALNSVLPECFDSFLLFLDDDVRCSSDLLVKYFNAFNKYGKEYFYGGPTRVDYDSEPSEWLKKYLPISAIGFDYEGDFSNISEPLFLGFNWGLHSSLINKIGGFDPAYGPGSTTGSTGQETNAMVRCIEGGFLGIYVQGAIVWHYVPEERCSQAWLLKRAYKNGVQFGQSQEWEGPHWFSVPRWMHRRRIILKLESIIASFSGNEKKTFQQKYEYQFLKGQIKGAFLRHKEILS